MAVKKKNTAENARIIAERKARGGQHRDKFPPLTPPSKVNLASYWSIQGGLRWLLAQTEYNKLDKDRADIIHKTLIAGGEMIKKRMQRHGEWVDKKEHKHQVDVSDKLAACLAMVQGADVKELKQIHGEVKQIAKELE
jgi:hypothetical protein